MKKIFFFNILKKIEKIYLRIILTSVIWLVSIGFIFAEDPVLVTGTVDLFEAITGWLLLIIPVSAGAVLGYHALQKSLTDEQSIIAEKNRLMKNVIIGAVIAETASGLVKIILSYYGG